MRPRVIISVATTSDGFMDDTSPERLILSNQLDWQQVYGLRSSCDAIIVGAQTIRRDNPSLTIKSNQQQDGRIARGMAPEITRVVVSGSGRLDPQAKIFAGSTAPIVFTNHPIEMNASVVVMPQITASAIVEQLANRGYNRIIVEGGGSILKMFIEQGAVDYIRHAIAPGVATEGGYSHLSIERPVDYTEQLGEMTINHHYINREQDEALLMKAIELSHLCTPSMSSYCVGSVVVTLKGETFTGYTHQSAPSNHAEEEAIGAALSSGADLRGATIYASMEPCSQRKSKPKSCSQLIIEHGLSRVVYALAEPDLFVECQATAMLIQAGVEVNHFHWLAPAVRSANSHLIK